jgi:hypothetical protein
MIICPKTCRIDDDNDSILCNNHLHTLLVCPTIFDLWSLNLYVTPTIYKLGNTLTGK